ncbi:MAG: helix-turn-helix transcriptional regulator [Clostridium sp.]
MGKLGGVLRMLFLLKGNKIVKKKYLADELGVSLKQISRYKEELDEFFFIETFSGKNGGYRLRDEKFPFKKILNKKESRELEKVLFSMETNSDENENVVKIIRKVIEETTNEKNITTAWIIGRTKKNVIGRENENEIEENIINGISNELEIILDYSDGLNEKTSRRIQPYKYFIYEGEKYITGKCLKRNELRTFKIARIEKCILTSFKFIKELKIEQEIEEKRKNSIGIFSDKEYEIELLIKSPMSKSIRERVWVENQEIVELENGDIIFKAKMSGKISIIKWLFRMKEYVKIIKPLEIRRAYIDVVERMLENNR